MRFVLVPKPIFLCGGSVFTIVTVLPNGEKVEVFSTSLVSLVYREVPVLGRVATIVTTVNPIYCQPNAVHRAVDTNRNGETNRVVGFHGREKTHEQLTIRQAIANEVVVVTVESHEDEKQI